MKLKDLIWIAIVLAFLALMVVPPVSSGYNWLNANLPYVAGFIKFFVLATMGDILAVRIRNKRYVKVQGLIWRALIYGFIGILMTLVFQVFSGGVKFAMSVGYLPFAGNVFFTAFFTSVCMNLFFAPAFMTFHRVTDTMIDMRCEARGSGVKIRLRDVLKNIDFADFIGFVIIKTVPIFWIPAHTVTFLLPNEYRVLFAAVLSVAMGAILSFAKSRAPKKIDAVEV